ncbi:MAG: radical SAM protein [archaeon]
MPMDFLFKLPFLRYYYNRYKLGVPETFFIPFRLFMWFELRRAFGQKVIPGMFLSPSQTCNCDCKHCYEVYDGKRIKESLTLKEIKSVIDQFKSMDGRYIVFCSGEFLLRKDALEIINYAFNKEIFTILVTNGLLINEASIKELKKAGLREVVVSIDSMNAEKHDELRGVKGCHKKAINSLKLAKKCGLETSIWTYISRSNIHELEEIEKLAIELDITDVFCYFPLLSGKFFNKPDENLTFEEREDIRKKFKNSKKFFLEFATEDTLCTAAAEYHLNVNPAGEVTFCPPVPYSYGNIKNEPLKKIYARMRKDFKRFRYFKGQCPVNNPDYRRRCKARKIVEVDNKLK